MTGIPFGAGEFIEFREPNAAGYGDPLERDPEAVREDVLDDFTTIELARDAYGVVFADERTLELDARRDRGAARRAPRSGRNGSSLGEYFGARGLTPSSSPVSRRREPGVRDRVKAYEVVAERLRAEILEGARPPGHAPLERDRPRARSSASAGRPCGRRCACSAPRT